jgi:hypothetical protein
MTAYSNRDSLMKRRKDGNVRHCSESAGLFPRQLDCATKFNQSFWLIEI